MNANRALEVVQSALRTVVRKYRTLSDYGRWQNVDSLSADWDSRTKMIASLVPPGASVLEFGAGRQVLRNFLPAGCRYTPSDLVDRGDGTIVCDLNANRLPDFAPHDVIVFSGVLEYVNDVPRLIRHLAPTAPTIIASYAVSDVVASRIWRRSDGWVNDFSSRAFEQVFETLAFRSDHVSTWREQKIYRFRRTSSR